ncbi:hypothetical protein R1flu_017409 [Riccia fluitans]|uniref:Uncharacterized protein n=1 Tax=Riccia fluitans TaxID=41844 RepID=A0ABD1ZFA4_9MARC
MACLADAAGRSRDETRPLPDVMEKEVGNDQSRGSRRQEKSERHRKRELSKKGEVRVNGVARSEEARTSHGQEYRQSRYR